MTESDGRGSGRAPMESKQTRVVTGSGEGAIAAAAALASQTLQASLNDRFRVVEHQVRPNFCFHSIAFLS